MSIPLDNSLVPVRVNVPVFLKLINMSTKENLKENGPLLVLLLSNYGKKGFQDTHRKMSAWQLTQCLVI